MGQYATISANTSDLENGNITRWMENARTLYNPLEQARWNQSNIDSLFHAGEQRFINTYFQFFPNNNFQNFQFNLIQQPINMVTGYQRQHRKNISFIPVEGSQQQLADDLSDLETYANSLRRRLEKYSQGCEFSAIQGMCLLQPYLDWRGEDPINGSLDLAVWPYNSYFIDPFFRDQIELTDCNFIWTQKFITHEIAHQYWPDKSNLIQGMTGQNSPSSFNFYFLPENYNSVKNQFLTLSQIWYQSRRKKKMLYNRQDGLTYDFYDDEKFIDRAAFVVGDFDVIEIEVPTWNVAVVLNDQEMYNGRNPLKFDRCPFVPMFWNYDPHLSQPDLRVRSLTRPMRDVQFLMNRRIIINHDISESSINTGFIRKENMLVDENVTKRVGQGQDIVYKEGFEITDIQKIIPNAVPPSDLELANQLADLIFRVSGVNEELMGMSSDTETGIQEMLRQGAGLVTLQKYFDQWDTALKQIGVIDKDIFQYNWSYAKVARILGREPSNEFETKIFSRTGVLVEEGLNTTIQQQQNFANIIQLNEVLGGALPPKSILDRAVIHDKNAIVEEFEQAQQAQQQIAQMQMALDQARGEAEIQKLQSSSVADVAMARERDGRKDSNIGLYEERMSEVTQNRSIALKNEVDALEKLTVLFAAFGKPATIQNKQRLDAFEDENIVEENVAKAQAQQIAEENEAKLMQDKLQNSNVQQQPQNQGLLS